MSGGGLGEGDPHKEAYCERQGEYDVALRIQRSAVTNPQTCPGIRNFIRPTMKYVKCHECGGDVEIWSDEDSGFCLACNAEWIKPDNDVSCLEYCEYADACKEIIEAKKPPG